MPKRFPPISVDFSRLFVENPDVFDIKTLGVFSLLWMIDSGLQIEKPAIYKHLRIRRQTFNAILKRLESRGLIIVLTHPHDYRLHVRISEKQPSEDGPLGAHPLPSEDGPLGAHPLPISSEDGPLGAQPRLGRASTGPTDALGGGGGCFNQRLLGNGERKAFSAASPLQMLSIQDILRALGPVWEAGKRVCPSLEPSSLLPHLKEARQWLGSAQAGDERFKGAFCFWLRRLERRENLREPLAMLRSDLREGHYSPPPENVSKKAPSNVKSERVPDPLDTGTADDFLAQVKKVSPFLEKHVTKEQFFRTWGAAYSENPAWPTARARLICMAESGELKFRRLDNGAA